VKKHKDLADSRMNIKLDDPTMQKEHTAMKANMKNC
jgi:hypothetical protein